MQAVHMWAQSRVLTQTVEEREFLMTSHLGYKTFLSPHVAAASGQRFVSRCPSQSCERCLLAFPDSQAFSALRRRERAASGCLATTRPTAHSAASRRHIRTSLPWELCPDLSPSIVIAHTKGSSRGGVVTAPAFRMHARPLFGAKASVDEDGFSPRKEQNSWPSPRASAASWLPAPWLPFSSGWCGHSPAHPRLRPSLSSSDASDGSQSSHPISSPAPSVSCPHASQVSKAAVAMELAED